MKPSFTWTQSTVHVQYFPRSTNAIAMQRLLVSLRGFRCRPLLPRHRDLGRLRFSRALCQATRDFESRVVPEIASALRLGGLSQAELKAAFTSLDTDASGSLDLREIFQLMQTLGLGDRRADAAAVDLMKKVDSDGDGRISFAEFESGIAELVAVHRASYQLAMAGSDLRSAHFAAMSTLNLSTFSDQEIQDAFRRMDQDGDGRVDFSELSAVLRHLNSKLAHEESLTTTALLMHELDKDKDGFISFEEFRSGVTSLAQRYDNRVVPISAAMFLSGISVGAATPAFPVLGTELHLSEAQFGYTVSAMGLSTTLSSLLSAVLVDRYGRKPVLQAGLVFQGMGMVAGGAAGSLEPFVASKFVSGFGVSSLSTGSTVAVADLSTPLNRARMMATMHGGFSAGKVLGPAIGGVLIGWIGASNTLIAASSGFLAAAMYSSFYLAETMPQSLKKTSSQSSSVQEMLRQMISQWRSLITDGKLKMLMLLNAVGLAAHAGSNFTLLPLMLAGDHFAMSPAEIGSVFAAQAAISVFGTGPAAMLIDKLGPERVIVPAILVTSFSMAAFPMAGDLLQAGILLAAWQLGRTVLNSAPTVLAANSVPKESLPQCMAMLRTTGDLGFMLGASLVGIGGSLVGAGPAMQSTAAISCGVAVWCAYMEGRQVSHSRRPNNKFS
ncbi:unnamed protein product [Symbiodinium natans]|uniref:Calmodulin n=1 Tax=Symbiodinium natans TaxID=878477 RepID=A0A812L2P8_9DINO|nr:unnamed protein product [Symbiodinium natans]